MARSVAFFKLVYFGITFSSYKANRMILAKSFNLSIKPIVPYKLIGLLASVMIIAHLGNAGIAICQLRGRSSLGIRHIVVG